MGSTVYDIDIRKNFLKMASFAQELRLTADKQDIIKLKNSCRAKEASNWVKKKPYRMNKRESLPAIHLAKV